MSFLPIHDFVSPSKIDLANLLHCIKGDAVYSYKRAIETASVLGNQTMIQLLSRISAIDLPISDTVSNDSKTSLENPE